MSAEERFKPLVDFLYDYVEFFPTLPERIRAVEELIKSFQYGDPSTSQSAPGIFREQLFGFSQMYTRLSPGDKFYADAILRGFLAYLPDYKVENATNTTPVRKERRETHKQNQRRDRRKTYRRTSRK